MSEPTREQTVQAIRDLAQWLEDHPEAPVPNSVSAQYSLLTRTPDNAYFVRGVAALLGAEAHVDEAAAFLRIELARNPHVSYAVHGFLSEEAAR